MTKHRIITAVIGIPLLALGAFVGGGSSAIVMGVSCVSDGGWFFEFVAFGLIALIAAAPALLIFLALAVVWSTPLARHFILGIVLSLVLGTSATVICTVTGLLDIDISKCLATAVFTCLAIVAFIGIIMKRERTLLHSARD